MPPNAGTVTFARVTERYLGRTVTALRYGLVVQATLIDRVQVGRFVPSPPYTVLPSASGWLVQGDGRMGLLASDLALISEFEIPRELSGQHAVASEGRLAALSLEGRVGAIDPNGRELWSTPVPLGEQGMGSCWFLPGDAAICALAPGEEDMDVLVLIDAATGEILDREETDTVAAWSFQFGHSGSGWHGLSVGYGQNGSVTRWVDTRDGITVCPAFDNMCAFVGGVSPDGSRYVTYPHPACEVLSVNSFPSAALEVSVTESELFGERRSGGQIWGIQNAGYLDDERILVSPDGLPPVVLAAQDLSVIAEVEYPSSGDRSVCGPQAADGTWTTNDPVRLVLERWVLTG